MHDESDAWRRVDGATAICRIQRRVGDDAHVDGRWMGREKAALYDNAEE